MMAALKSLLYNFSICVISVLASFDCLFSLQLKISFSWYDKWFWLYPGHVQKIMKFRVLFKSPVAGVLLAAQGCEGSTALLLSSGDGIQVPSSGSSRPPLCLGWGGVAQRYCGTGRRPWWAGWQWKCPTCDFRWGWGHILCMIPGLSREVFCLARLPSLHI